MLKMEGELPSLEDVVKAPGTTRLPTKADAQMLVCYKLAHLVSDATLAPVIQYIERLPADFSVTFAKALVTRDVMFVQACDDRLDQPQRLAGGDAVLPEVIAWGQQPPCWPPPLLPRYPER